MALQTGRTGIAWQNTAQTSELHQEDPSPNTVTRGNTVKTSVAGNPELPAHPLGNGAFGAQGYATNTQCVRTPARALGGTVAQLLLKQSPQSTAVNTPRMDLQSVQKHMEEQPWFAGRGKPIADVAPVSRQDVPVPGQQDRFELVGLDVRFADGSAERYLAPLAISRDGHVADALAVPEFRAILLHQVEQGGERFGFVPPAFQAPSTATAAPVNGPSTGAGGPVADGYDPKTEANALAQAMAGTRNHWSMLLDKGYTTPAQFAFVQEKTRELSPENADALLVEFFRAVAQTLESQPVEVREFHEALKTRPQFMPTLYGYAQYMAVPDGKQVSRFSDLERFMDLAHGNPSGPYDSMMRGGSQGFGFESVELLPFFPSPQKDGGYDVAQFDGVDARFGGDTEHARFMDKAVKLGIRVTADLIANHVSNEHPWVKALLSGDESMLSRFVIWDDAVKIGERTMDDRVYNVFLHTRGPDAGKVSHVWQIFPDNNPDTLIQFKTHGEPHQAFASFMNPDQWDVNLCSPEVFAHHLHAISHFANLGQMGFRMDAIIHGKKTPGTTNIDLPETQAFMALSKSFADHVAPGVLLIPEANLPPDQARREWLEPERVLDGTVKNTAGDALISFRSHEAIWNSLLKEDKSAWLQNLRNVGNLPPHKSVMNYLTLHDEILVPDEEVRKQLLAQGFTDFAGRGVGDAAAELLGHNQDRLAMAAVLLYASKGHPAVYYRNLVAAPNDVAHFETKAAERKNSLEAAGLPPDPRKIRDSRDLNRGAIPARTYETALQDGAKVALTYRALNALWSSHAAVRTRDIRELTNANASVVSLARVPDDPGASSLLQLINLSGKPQTVELQADEVSRNLGWHLADRMTLKDILRTEMTGQSAIMDCERRGSKVVLTLEPYQCVYLDAQRS